MTATLEPPLASTKLQNGRKRAENEQHVLELLTVTPSMNTNELADRIKLHRSCVSNLLRAMEGRFTVRMISPGVTGGIPRPAVWALRHHNPST